MEKIRLDLYLASQNKHYSRTQLKKLIEDGFVLVNGEKRKPGFILHGGEKIEMVRRAPEIPKAQAEDIPLDILYEDDYLMIINKAVGMVAHPAPGHFTGTLVNAILHHMKGKIEAGDAARPGIVHRLDKGTSGLMLIAKNDLAHRSLSGQFKDRTISKTYLALAFGNFDQRKGTISKAIGRDSQHRRKFSSKTRYAREAVTNYKVYDDYERLTLLELHPETGRTHQIRVHLSEIHHPIVGDTTYGAKAFLSSIKTENVKLLLEGVERPLLHAWKIEFNHPSTGERIKFEAPVASDFKDVIERLKKETKKK